MHELFNQVLSERDLSKAGDLFSLEDKDIEADLTEVIHRINDIAKADSYLINSNDQSVVEICINRVTAAIRYIFSDVCQGSFTPFVEKIIIPCSVE